jgi:hypothetical protein
VRHNSGAALGGFRYVTHRDSVQSRLGDEARRHGHDLRPAFLAIDENRH